MLERDAASGSVDGAAVLRVLPAGRRQEPEELGRLAVCPCSKDTPYVNGSCVTIHGLFTAVPAGWPPVSLKERTHEYAVRWLVSVAHVSGVTSCLVPALVRYASVPCSESQFAGREPSISVVDSGY
jgi:hypothetical protein